MNKIRCKRCTGFGQIMGGGMIYIDCSDCDGEGHVYKYDDVMKEVDSIKANPNTDHKKNVITDKTFSSSNVIGTDFKNKTKKEAKKSEPSILND